MSDQVTVDPAAVLWTRQNEGSPLLVLLHGYGADERDLFGLAPYLPEAYAIAAVRAPLTPPFPAPGYSWYAIGGLDDRDPAGVTRGAEAFLAWLDEHVPADTTVGLLGFSQGGAIALQSLRLHPERFAFAINLSGYVATGDLPGDAALAERRPPVFWGRGSADEVIPEPLIAHTVQWLPGHVELSGRVYPGLTHSVSEDELTDIATFLGKQLES